MKKINTIKESREFERIIKNNRPYRTDLFIVYLEMGDFPLYKFGLSVGKKVGPAVTRNKIKRQLKNIIDQNLYQKTFNCIIIVKKEITMYNFQEIEKALNKVFQSLKMIKGENQ